MEFKITFDESAKKDVLDFFDKSVNNENFIVEKNNKSQLVYTFEKDNITLDEFGGLQKGSEVFIKKDLISLMRLSKLTS